MRGTHINTWTIDQCFCHVYSFYVQKLFPYGRSSIFFSFFADNWTRTIFRVNIWKSLQFHDDVEIEFQSQKSIESEIERVDRW